MCVVSFCWNDYDSREIQSLGALPAPPPICHPFHECFAVSFKDITVFFTCSLKPQLCAASSLPQKPCHPQVMAVNSSLLLLLWVWKYILFLILCVCSYQTVSHCSGEEIQVNWVRLDWEGTKQGMLSLPPIKSPTAVLWNDTVADLHPVLRYPDFGIPVEQPVWQRCHVLAQNCISHTSATLGVQGTDLTDLLPAH